jgi:hypothetical protein
MARRSYYPSSVGGFADGFTQGFGLMQDAENARLDRELQARRYDEQSAAEERRFRASQSKLDRSHDLDEKRLQGEIDGRKAQADAAAAAAEAADETRIFQQGITSLNAKTAAEKAETERLRQEGLTAAAANTNQSSAKDQYKVDAATAMQNVFSMIQSGQFTEDQILEQIMITDTPVDIGGQSSGNAMSMLKLMAPDFQETLASVSAELSSQFATGKIDPSHPVMLEAFDRVFSSSRGGIVGKTIDESFTNPTAQKFKGYTVENRRTTNITANENGELTATVVVAARDPKTGRVVFYPADVTENRNPAAGQASTPIKDVIDGIAGLSVMTQEVNRIKPLAENVLINNREGGRQKYNEDVEALVSQMRAAKDADVGGNTRTYFKRKPDSQMTVADMRRFAESKVLYGAGDDGADYEVALKRYIDEGRKPIEKLLARAKDMDGKQINFTDAEMLRVIATTNDDGRQTKDTEEELVRMLKGRGYLEGGGGVRTRRDRQASDSPNRSGYGPMFSTPSGP